jgi:hypothetical protein
MAEDFDLTEFLSDDGPENQYQEQLRRLRSIGNETECIEAAVEGALANLGGSAQTSFVIYGEPQSGKTEMMICLTAKLLDDGNRFVVHMLNDSVDLLGQNMRRFHASGLAPSAQNFSEILDPSISIKNGKHVVFCKKNGSDLRKLIDKIGILDRVIVIDDEADYATPNAKVNKGEKTPINDLIERIIGKTGHYIGVTATPARLNLNNTLQNDSSLWVRFPAHRMYTGQDDFFPLNLEEIGTDGLPYRLRLMNDRKDDGSEERQALFRFMVNVAHLNMTSDTEQNYSFLVHTSGKKIDHKKDLAVFRNVLSELSDKQGAKFGRYTKEIWEIANRQYTDISPTNITKYIISNISRHAVIVLNSEPDFKNFGGNATTPSALFTIVIGGNIVSRGVTFNNLLSMFFTRDVKTKLQQDTYVQRARMFGSRGRYLKHFELTIPTALYVDWHRCFVYHRLALESIQSGLGSPVWIADTRIAAVAAASIDRSTVDLDKGEMSFSMFEFDPAIDVLASGESEPLRIIEGLAELVGAAFPTYLRTFLRQSVAAGVVGLKLLPSGSVFPGMTDEEKERIERRQGFLTIRAADRGRSRQQCGTLPPSVPQRQRSGSAILQVRRIGLVYQERQMIHELEKYHGLVLRDIIVCAGQATIAKHDLAGRVNCYKINGHLGLLIKHSTSRLTPWVFSYNRAQMSEVQEAASACETFWLAHVCGGDGIMTLSMSEFSSINPPGGMTTCFVRVDKSRNTMYRVFGTGGELPFKKSRGVGCLVSSLVHEQ